MKPAGGVNGGNNGYGILAGSPTGLASPGGFNQVGAIDLDNVTIDGYNKNAIVVGRTGSTATITNSNITGFGTQPNIAQNGIVVSDGATATIANNTIKNNICSAPGCAGFDFNSSFQLSYGVLLFQSGTSTISGNTFDNNDGGVYSWTPGFGSTVDKNTFTQVRYTGVDLDQGTHTVNNNLINGGGVTGVRVLSYGPAPGFAGNTANTFATLRSNSITGKTQAGVELDDETGDAYFPVVTSADFNRIAGNAVGLNNTTTSTLVNAENNFWGCNDGPQLASGNGCDTISAMVDADPWLKLSGISATPTSVNTSGTSTVSGKNLRINSDGTDTYALPGNPHVPDGITVNYTATFGTTTPISTTIVNGLAVGTTTFTGGGPYSGNQLGGVTATVDNAQDTAAITVNDTTAPTVTINQKAGQPDPANGVPVEFTAVFDEVVTDFTGADVSITGVTFSSIVVTDSGDGKTFNVAVTPTSSGVVTATIPAGGAFDPANNPNDASTSMDNTVTFFTGAIELVVDDGGMNCLANGAPVYTTIQGAVAAASPGYIINVCPGIYPTTTNTTLSLAGLTIQNALATKPDVNVSGGSLIFTVLASDVTIKGLNIIKTDETNQNVIQIQGANFKGLNNYFTASTSWIVNNVTTRAFEISSSAANFLLDGNTITDFRQPAYINGDGVVGSPVLGKVSNNTATRTKGFVVAGANVTFTGNVFGQTCAACGADIALFSNSDPTFYTPSNLLAISANNDDAYISVQFPTNPSPSGRAVTFVNKSAAAGGDGRSANPRQTIQDGVNNTLPGGTVNVAAGTYTENITVNRQLNVLGPNAANDPNTGTRGGGSNCLFGGQQSDE